MEIVAVLALAMAIVAVLLVPPYVVGRVRMAKARAAIESEPHLMTGFILATGGARPVGIYLATTAGVLILGVVITMLVSLQLEPSVSDNLPIMLVLLLVWSPPILLAVILIGMLISLAATGRARSRYFDALAVDPALSEPARAAAGTAAEHLRGGRGLIGVSGTAAAAAIACLALGLGWVALLFTVAGSVIQCSRSAKCL